VRFTHLLLYFVIYSKCVRIKFSDGISKEYDRNADIIKSSRMFEATYIPSSSEDKNEELELPFRKGYVEMMEGLLMDESTVKDVTLRKLRELLLIESYLDLSSPKKELFYRNLAKGVFIINIHSHDVFNGFLMKEKPPSETYFHLLRGYASLGGVDVRVINGVATLYVKDDDTVLKDENEEDVSSIKGICLLKLTLEKLLLLDGRDDPSHIITWFYYMTMGSARII